MDNFTELLLRTKEQNIDFKSKFELILTGDLAAADSVLTIFTRAPRNLKLGDYTVNRYQIKDNLDPILVHHRINGKMTYQPFWNMVVNYNNLR